MMLPVHLMMVLALTGNAQDGSAQTVQRSQDASTPFDSIWAGGDIPTQPPTPLEQVMLSQDKLYVVLAVVLIIWIGIVVLLLRNDAHLRKLERTAEEHISDQDAL